MLDFILGAHTLQSVDKSQVKPGNSQTRNANITMTVFLFALKIPRKTRVFQRLGLLGPLALHPHDPNEKRRLKVKTQIKPSKKMTCR